MWKTVSEVHKMIYLATSCMLAIGSTLRVSANPNHKMLLVFLFSYKLCGHNFEVKLLSSTTYTSQCQTFWSGNEKKRKLACDEKWGNKLAPKFSLFFSSCFLHNFKSLFAMVSKATGALLLNFVAYSESYINSKKKVLFSRA